MSFEEVPRSSSSEELRKPDLLIELLRDKSDQEELEEVFENLNKESKILKELEGLF